MIKYTLKPGETVFVEYEFDRKVEVIENMRLYQLMCSIEDNIIKKVYHTFVPLVICPRNRESSMFKELVDKHSKLADEFS